MSDACSRQRRQCGKGVIEPPDERCHMFWYFLRWRCLEMHGFISNPTGDDLHRVFVETVRANAFQIGSSLQQCGVPFIELSAGKWRGIVSVDRHQHLRHARFGGLHVSFDGREPQFAPYGRLHTVSVEQLAFDLRGFHSFRAENLHDDLILILLRQMLHRPGHRAEKTGIFSFQGLQLPCIVGEDRPVFLLPIPRHREV